MIGSATATTTIDNAALKAELAAFDADAAGIRDGMARAREFFTSLGVTEAEGNGPVRVELAPGKFEAAYQAERLFYADGTTGRRNERIEIGRNPYTGTSFARAADVLAHEFTHRINEHIVPGLGQSPTSRVVDESLADTFAAAVDGNWTIGEAIMPDGGLRSLEHAERHRVIRGGEAVWEAVPTSMAEITPASMQRGPYPNIGPLNNAAFRIGSKLGMRPMAEIYLQTLRHHLNEGSGPTDLVLGTLKSAKELFPTDPSKLQAVRDAWIAVGVRPAAVNSV